MNKVCAEIIFKKIRKKTTHQIVLEQKCKYSTYLITLFNQLIKLRFI